MTTELEMAKNAIAERMPSPATPKFVTNHINDAKQWFGCLLICVGIQLPIAIKTMTDMHIVTSYLPLGLKGSFRNDRIAHSIPKTI